MRVKFGILALAGLAAYGQSSTAPNSSQVFPFTFIQDPRQFQDVANTVQRILDISQVTIDATARTLNVTGSPDQIAALNWLLPKLDRPAAPSGQKLASVQYNMAGNALIQVFYLSNTQLPGPLQGHVNAIRSLVEIQRAAACMSARVIVIQTTAEQAAATEWLLQLLDQPPVLSSDSGFPELRVFAYPFPDLPGMRGNTAMRVFYPAHTMTPQAIQEAVNAIRSVAEVQRIVAVERQPAIALRGTPDEAALSEWILSELDQPAVTSSSHNYSSGFLGGVAAVLHLGPAAAGQTPQEVVAGIKSATGLLRVTFCSLPRALAVRGTADQVAMAEKMIQPSVPAH